MKEISEKIAFDSDICPNYEAYYDEYLKLKAENEILRDIIVKFVIEKYREK